MASGVVGAYQSPVTAAGRSDVYRPFLRLNTVVATMCWRCTPPAVWHALLSLLRYASAIHCVSRVLTNDPLIVASLSHLPSIATLSSDCLWPASFATFIEQRNEETGQYRYLEEPVMGYERHRCPGKEMMLELSDIAEGGDIGGPVLLRTLGLFTAYQRSLTADLQAALARWVTGDFRDGDEQLSAAESASVQCDEEEGDADEQSCRHPHLFSTRYTDDSEDEMSDVERAA